MKVAIMQPYFFPYIGYWQLINAVDKFVIYDDVNYIKGGWINRNRIIINGRVQFLSMRLKGASPNKLINEVCVSYDNLWLDKTIKTIEMSYHKAPYFKESFGVITEALNNGEGNLGEYLTYIIRILCDYLDIQTKIVLSSGLDKDNLLKGQDKVIDICKMMKADCYINSIGGIGLYDKDAFENEGIHLKFLNSENIEYQQFSDEYEHNLSIIDVLMFNGKEKTENFLNEYALV